MRTRREIQHAADLTRSTDHNSRELLSNIINSRLILETLLDIRDLLQPEIIFKEVEK